MKTFKTIIERVKSFYREVFGQGLSITHQSNLKIERPNELQRRVYGDAPAEAPKRKRGRPRKHSV